MTEPKYDGRLDGPVHEWFELSHAHYLTVPRSVLQSMPVEWQTRFAKCLRELDEALPWRPRAGRYWVTLKDEYCRYVSDPFNDYRHADVWTPEACEHARKSHD
uniref:Uncharacterized protein n=1 Tax=viral metagenome TaxID=1070528 RepID=A0A6M3JFL3_9ZZZZ